MTGAVVASPFTRAAGIPSQRWGDLCLSLPRFLLWIMLEAFYERSVICSNRPSLHHQAASSRCCSARTTALPSGARCPAGGRFMSPAAVAAASDGPVRPTGRPRPRTWSCGGDRAARGL